MKKALTTTLPLLSGTNQNILKNTVARGNNADSTRHTKSVQVLVTRLRNMRSILDDCRAVELLVDEADERASKPWYKRTPEDIEKQVFRTRSIIE